MDLETEIKLLIEKAILEDIGTGDLTSLTCLPETRETTGVFTMKQAGIVAGLPLLNFLFQSLNTNVEVSLLVPEGSFQKSGSQIAKVSGHAHSILAGERIAVNLLGHASGIASITADYVKKVNGMECDILDTRKTLPGLRALEKYAVAIGGGKNHRYGLDDCFLIKSSHLAFLSGGDRHPIAEAMQKIQEKKISAPIEIQIDNPSYMDEVLKYDFKMIMFRNLTLEQLENCIYTFKKTNKRTYLAYSGNVTLETTYAIAKTGINGILVPALTYSVPSKEICMRIK